MEDNIMKRKKIESGQPIDVKMTMDEKSLILEKTYAGPDLTDRLSNSQIKGKNFKIKYTLEELNSLLGYITVEASQTNDSLLQNKLDNFYSRLRKEMESYDDGRWQSNF
jgi:hypothetical protein